MADAKVVEIIDRLKAFLGARSDNDLAKKLRIPQSTLANWRKSGRITVGATARIATKIGKSIEWIATGQEAATQALAAASLQVARLQERVLDLPFPAFDVAEEFLSYIEHATPEARETIRRLLRGLKASPEVRTHLIGQLKLIERLIEAEQPPREDAAADPPSRAQAS